MLVRKPLAHRSFGTNIYKSFVSLVIVFACTVSPATCHGQAVQPQPVTDSSAQASPLTAVPHALVDDRSAQSSPVPPRRGSGPYIAAHTPIPIALGQDIDSGKLKQGQDLSAQLSAPVPVRGGVTLPAGTPVLLSVIASVPAGRIAAQGEFSLQVLHVGGMAVFTDTLVFEGKPGHQDLPDSAPALGTDAGLPQGAPLTFHVQPSPTFVQNAPQDREHGPGSVNGVASGSPPPASSLKSSYADGNGTGSGKTPGQQQPSTSPGDTTTNQGTQNLGQPSVAPNQPQSPAQNAPTPTRPQ